MSSRASLRHAAEPDCPSPNRRLLPSPTQHHTPTRVVPSGTPIYAGPPEGAGPPFFPAMAVTGARLGRTVPQGTGPRRWGRTRLIRRERKRVAPGGQSLSRGRRKRCGSQRRSCPTPGAAKGTTRRNPVVNAALGSRTRRAPRVGLGEPFSVKRHFYKLSVRVRRVCVLGAQPT